MRAWSLNVGGVTALRATQEPDLMGARWVFTSDAWSLYKYYYNFIYRLAEISLNVMLNHNQPTMIQWWFVNPDSDSPEILLVRTKSAGTNFRVRTNGRFSNPENLLIRKYWLGTNVSGLTNHHCIYIYFFKRLPLYVHVPWQQYSKTWLLRILRDVLF